MKVPIIKEILSANSKLAQENADLFKDNKMLVINVMASPGAGKTSLILSIMEELKKDFNFGVIEGDIASSIDADKIEAFGIPVVQINTGGSCHLDATMIGSCLQHFDLKKMDILFIENVGNLICPASYKLGENLSMVIGHVAEGHDKPHKYPGIFSLVDLVVLNKTDLAEPLEFDYDFFRKGVRLVNKEVPMIETSCKTKAGVKELCEWISDRAWKIKNGQ